MPLIQFSFLEFSHHLEVLEYIMDTQINRMLWKKSPKQTIGNKRNKWTEK